MTRNMLVCSVLVSLIVMAGCVTVPTVGSGSGTGSSTAGAKGADVAYDSEGKKSIKVRQTDRGTVIAIGEKVFFETGKSELSASGKDLLIKVADTLKTRTQANVVIEGHTDAQGSAQLNQQLSLRRANSVKDFLVTNGVQTQRLKAEGFGLSKPIASNDTVDGRQANRRTEIIVLGEKEENLTKQGEPKLGDSLAAGFDKFIQNAGAIFKGIFGEKKE